MKKKELEKYKKLLIKYIDNLVGNETIDELIEIFIGDIFIIGTDYIINELLPVIKYYIKKNIKNFNETGCDLFFVTIHPELFLYTLSFADEIDVIELMLENADGLEEYYTIEEIMIKNNLTLSKKIINKHFSHLTDESKNNLITKEKEHFYSFNFDCDNKKPIGHCNLAKIKEEIYKKNVIEKAIHDLNTKTK